MYLPILFQTVPVQPGDDIILTVGIVISELRIAELVPGVEHRRPSAAHQRCKSVFHHTPPQLLYLRVIRRACRSAVPAIAVVVPVRVVPAVLLIMLYIIRIQII